MDSATSPLAGLGAIVTGASSGIGAAVARALGDRGVRVTLFGRDEARLAETSDPIASGRGYPVELTDDRALTAALDGAVTWLGGVDLLVHSAGVFHLGSVRDTPVDALDRMVAVNLRAPYVATRAVLDQLVAARGQVVFVNTTAALRPGAGTTAYSAAKTGLRALADGLRDEVNAAGVRVLSIFPGRTASPMQASLRSLEGLPYRPERLIQPADVAAATIAALELPRTAEVTEITVRPMQKP